MIWIIAAAWALLLAFVVALCKAAARADRILEAEERRIAEAYAPYDSPQPGIGFQRGWGG